MTRESQHYHPEASTESRHWVCHDNKPIDDVGSEDEAHAPTNQSAFFGYAPFVSLGNILGPFFDPENDTVLCNVM